MVYYFSKLLLNIALIGSILEMGEGFHMPHCIQPKLRNHVSKYQQNICMSMERRNMLLKSLLIFNIPFLNKIASNAFTVDEENHIKLYETVAPSACYISTEYNDIANKLSINTTNIPKGVGTGFVWDKQGHIVTNFHVINKVDKAQVTLTNKYGISKDYIAKLTGVDPDKDIAVIKVDLNQSENMDLLPISLSQNKDIKIGQYSFAIGNPFGQDNTFTMGIISAKNRELTSPTGRKIKQVIQTDTPINPGNSGGPLINSEGQLIGMNTATMGMGVSSGVNFAISVDMVKDTVEQIIQYGTVQKAILGISYLERSPSIEESKKSGIPYIEKGVVVLNVPETSPAYIAGLRGIKKSSNTKEWKSNKFSNLDSSNITQNILGDVIIGMNDLKIENANDLLNALDTFKPGQIVNLHILRGNELLPLTLSLKLGSFRTSTFSGLQNEKNYTNDESSIPLDVPLQNLAPQITPKMPSQ